MTAIAAVRWVVLLRGVNVGGVTVRSADLTACLTAAGFEDVRTVLASGNALVTATGSERDVATRVETALRERYGRDVPALVRTQQEVRDVVEHSPYPSDSDTHHAYLLFTQDAAGAAELLRAAQAILADPGDAGVDEAVAGGDRLLYWWCPRGATLTTPISKSLPRVKGVGPTTTRNLRTMIRLTQG